MYTMPSIYVHFLYFQILPALERVRVDAGEIFTFLVGRESVAAGLGAAAVSRQSAR